MANRSWFFVDRAARSTDPAANHDVTVHCRQVLVTPGGEDLLPGLKRMRSGKVSIMAASAFHFDGVAKPYFADSALILSPPFATGMTQIGVATSAELRSDV